MKSILFVCSGNSARSIIAESIINNDHSDAFKAYSAGSNPSGKINEDIKEYLENVKKYNLKDYSSKNFQKFIDEKTEIDHVITVCNNANNEVCPIWPNKNQIDHWDIEDPVSKLMDKSKDQKLEIITKTFNNINQHINDWINFEK
ncbi:arsenate reductase ArsC [Candidatus Pelagibacter sp. HIMB1321]|uniref:arsenate reductase ArsC n=1 Tax=Candidatus Pelagibacter sp. HIMB1321 TaxID=1388755 RepID=UPI000A080271|nr:arsenate reductase ArsC [Candidatus Pelagibacter sp. HIMB1321]SMF75106.1 Low molecular weight phosphotyrosine protein phosphatase [Candidatus Pelagibacter sp. HIMB1321]